jgi:hypothetical protein
MVTAQSDTITVFLRSTVLWPFKHNDAYWDDAELTIESGTQPCDRAREPYDRTVVLFSPETTLEEAHDLLDEFWPQRRTFAFSADDAGIGCPGVANTVVAHNPSAWPGDLRQFFAQYYPNTVYTEYGEPSNPDILCQRDGRWKDEHLGASNCPYTIGQQGCYITALAMALRYYKIDAAATPLTVNAAIGEAGYSGCRPLWSAIQSKLGLKVTSPASVDLSGGLCAMAEVKPSSLEHFVLVVRQVDNMYWMYDPLTGAEGWLDEAYDGVESWRLLTPVQTTDTRVRIGLHLQGGADGIWPFYDATQSAVLKAFWLQAVDDLPAHSPETAFIYRYWAAHQSPYLYAEDKYASANKWIDNFRDSLIDVASRSSIPIYVCGLNEEVPTFDPAKLDHLIRFEMAFCDAVRAAHPNAYPVCFTAAVGNPHETEFELCVPLARKCEETGGLFNYHAYWWANPNESGLDSWWKYHAGRWQEMDKVFVYNGVHVWWFFGECGAVGSADGYNLLPGSGWKSDSCYAGNWARYQADIIEFQRRVREWNATHGNRAVGGTLFTTSGPGWASFEVQRAEMEKLAKVL